MKKSTGTAVIIILGMAVWFSTFQITRSRAIDRRQADTPAWMQNVPAPLARDEQAFSDSVQTAAQDLKSHQVKLGELLQDPAASDDAILAQADIIAQTHTALLHAIAEHLVALRTNLPDSQKELLSGFCRQTLGAPMQRRYRHGRQDPAIESPHQPDRGFGRGFGQQHRRGQCGLIQKLQFTDRQLALVQQKDPAFESDIRQLRSRLLDERSKLQTLLETGQNPNGQLMRQVNAVITAHNALEKRLIDFILTMRPHFTPDQQQRLIGLCQRNCIGECSQPNSD